MLSATRNQSKQIWLDDQAELPLKANSLNSDIQSTSVQRKEYAFDWGAFVLIEFLGSCQRLIGKYKQRSILVLAVVCKPKL